ncbi:hypothetical protein [uncultured Sphingomonas sp.]|uniref:hypothetical protein n=1 Tax=uncultured Sphingomonas sp. TaxID=158754 RepID=UPI0035CB5F2B
MLKLLRHLLLVGVLFGLAGNGVAVAAPCILMVPGQPAAMADMPDCAMGTNCPDCDAKLAKSGKSKGDKAPPAGCMLMTGCSVAMAMKDISPVAASSVAVAAPRFWMVAAPLASRAIAPEPEPPTLLG